jgi:HSP20 family protein
MALVRWQPNRSAVSNYSGARDPREDIECFFEDFFGSRPWWRGTSPNRPAGFTPRVNLKDTPEAFVLKVEVPGFDKEQIYLTITNDLVTLKGERPEEAESDNECFYCRESFAGSFERSIALPQSVDSDGAEAKLQKGILTVTLPKASPRKAVTINVS